MTREELLQPMEKPDLAAFEEAGRKLAEDLERKVLGADETGLQLRRAIRQFAMSRAGLSEEEYNTALRHPYGHYCRCCAKWQRYLQFKEAIEAWEAVKKT